MTSFLNIIKVNCVKDNQGKFFYFLGLIIVFFLCLSCLTVLLVSTINSNLFFIDRDSFDNTILNLESRYTPDRNIRFYEDSFYKYYLMYNRLDDSLRIYVSIDNKNNSYIEHKIDYIFEYGKIEIKYTYIEGAKENFSTEIIKKNNDYNILNKYKKDLNSDQITLANTMIDNSIIAFEKNALSDINSAISEYTLFQNIYNIVFIVSLTFFIFLFLVSISMLIIYAVAYNQPDIEDEKAFSKLTAETIAIMKEYKELLDNQIISEEEFTIIKSKLLNL